MTKNCRHLTDQERCQVNNSREERTFKGLDCATPDPHFRSDYTLTAMMPGVALPTGNGEGIDTAMRVVCRTLDWKRGLPMET